MLGGQGRTGREAVLVGCTSASDAVKRPPFDVEANNSPGAVARLRLHSSRRATGAKATLRLCSGCLLRTGVVVNPPANACADLCSKPCSEPCHQHKKAWVHHGSPGRSTGMLHWGVRNLWAANLRCKRLLQPASESRRFPTVSPDGGPDPEAHLQPVVFS